MVCRNARVENSELTFMEPSPEMVTHVVSNVILDQGRREVITMNGGVSGRVVDESYVGGFF